ncbi:glycosyltransferase family 2 protein [Aequorivita lipolytica]|uniref:Glycosyltransferase n=1 Tax=Aequorivita lipolytica TaxID=153267 RepID=A0A5C6YP80_9FLAO|nr:glycosyltransferase [Aequorivita lipolytica]TXD69259.1 glycosyltransferase [Aequorivita lipolytica]SRX50121.1 Undecaprenyl-phosphate 4-deoxy-4-formamido-L-arabinose transferase [Aequorivita lipolytica]
MIWVFIFLFASYFIFMVALVYGFKKVQLFFSAEIQPANRFTVVIPFRNEAENLPFLLKTIEELKYPLEFFEVIFVNDASEDSSEAIISQAIEKSKISIKLIQNKRVSASPKKDAISEAIKNSNFEWIVTTDADCELPENWLKELDAFIQKENPVMVCGPVLYASNGSFIENFQQLDGLSLQAVTVGSFGLNKPMLSNGANLAYSKNAFLKVNGFEGNNHIASGDDVFLLEKMKKTLPNQVRYLKSKEAVVSTKPQENWKNVVNQRIRWASKTSKQQTDTSLILGIVVFFVNISILASPLLMVFNPENLNLYIFLIVLKIITDYAVLLQASRFFEVNISLLKFLWQTFFYAIIVLIVVFGSFRGNYSWKGRSFEKQ